MFARHCISQMSLFLFFTSTLAVYVLLHYVALNDFQNSPNDGLILEFFFIIIFCSKFSDDSGAHNCTLIACPVWRSSVSMPEVYEKWRLVLWNYQDPNIRIPWKYLKMQENLENGNNRFGCTWKFSWNFFEVHSIRYAWPISCHCNEPTRKMIQRKRFEQIKFARLLFSFAFIFSPFHLTVVLFIRFIYFNIKWILLSNEFDSHLPTLPNATKRWMHRNIVHCLCIPTDTYIKMCRLEKWTKHKDDAIMHSLLG